MNLKTFFWTRQIHLETLLKFFHKLNVLKNLFFFLISENSIYKHIFFREEKVGYNVPLDTYNSVLTTFRTFFEIFRILIDPKSKTDEKFLLSQKKIFSWICSSEHLNCILITLPNIVLRKLIFFRSKSENDGEVDYRKASNKVFFPKIDHLDM